jgi:hypothetical protein
LSVGTSPEPAMVPLVGPADSLSSVTLTPGTARYSWLSLGVLFSAEVVILGTFNSIGRSFDFWAFSDSGANLTVQNLLKQGLTPAVDFGYHYGLLPLLIGRFWFALFGSTPLACGLLMTSATLLICFALARFAISLRLGLPSLTLLFLALPIATETGPNLAHVLEAALISNALADQAAQNHERSLALAGAAAFAKPSMAYLYGGLLLLSIAWHLRIAGKLTLHALWRAVQPTMVMVLVIGVLLVSVYGAPPLLKTLVPMEGIRAYTALNYGFLREGRNLWHPPGARVGYYAGTVAGFWLAGTLWLAVCALSAASKLWRASTNGETNAGDEMIVCCALLHTSFIVLFFGSAFSWIYYCYVLVMGVAATAAFGRTSKYLVFMLAVISALGQKASFVGDYRLRSMGEASEETAYLWATTPERREWQQVLRLLHDRHNADGKAVVLDEQGCVELLYSGFATPTTLYLFPGLATPKEVDRKLKQLSKASMVVVPSMQPLYHDFRRWWPQFSSALERYQPVMKGSFFTVYRRNSQSDAVNAEASSEVSRSGFSPRENEPNYRWHMH